MLDLKVSRYSSHLLSPIARRFPHDYSLETSLLMHEHYYRLYAMKAYQQHHSDDLYC